MMMPHDTIFQYFLHTTEYQEELGADTILHQSLSARFSFDITTKKSINY